MASKIGSLGAEKGSKYDIANIIGSGRIYGLRISAKQRNQNMAREKGTGNLQREKSGRWTVRVSINGHRISRSAGTRDKDKAEAFLNRFLAPMGLGPARLPLAEAWHHYEMSPNRRDIAYTTLNSKRNVWMSFARWMEHNHLEIGELSQVTEESVAEYLKQFRCNHSATTYNNHVCVLREVFRVLSEKAGITHDPWVGVCLRAADSMSRRELAIDEVGRLYLAASKQGFEWKLLFMTGIYTGLRLGDCCRLSWEAVSLEGNIIQLIPEKTKKHAHGRPVTIPIHKELREALLLTPEDERKGYVNPKIAEFYMSHKWRVDDGLRKIFKAANITMSVRVEGRQRKSVVASFHSLRHTFVSFAANAGVPLPVVQSIVGHSSTAMTRHYYHENEDELRRAVAAIPALDALRDAQRCAIHASAILPSAKQNVPIAQRLKQLEKLRKKGIVTEDEYASARARILSEL